MEDITLKILNNNIKYEDLKLEDFNKINNFNLQNFLENIVKQIDVNINDEDFENLINKLVYFINNFKNQYYFELQELYEKFFKYFVISLFEKNEMLFEKLCKINNNFLRQSISNIDNYDAYNVKDFLNQNTQNCLKNYFNYIKHLDNFNIHFVKEIFEEKNNNINKIVANLILDDDLNLEDLDIVENLNKQNFNIKTCIQFIGLYMNKNIDEIDFNSYFNNILLKINKIYRINEKTFNIFFYFFPKLFKSDNKLLNNFIDFILNDKLDNIFPETTNIRQLIRNNLKYFNHDYNIYQFVDSSSFDNNFINYFNEVCKPLEDLPFEEMSKDDFYNIRLKRQEKLLYYLKNKTTETDKPTEELKESIFTNQKNKQIDIFGRTINDLDKLFNIAKQEYVSK